MAWTALPCVAFFLVRTRRIALAVPSLALGAMLASQMLLLSLESFAPVRSTALLAGLIQPRLAPSTRVYVLNMNPPTLPFYLERPVTPVEFSGELEFGVRREPRKAIPTMNDFITAWQREPDAVAIMSLQTYDALVSASVPMKIIARDAFRVAVRRS